jgi:hypothetical protein
MYRFDVRLRLGVIAFFMLFAMTAHAAEPDARAKSRAYFVQGVAALEDTRPGDALALFERAYELYPHYSTLYNIGVCHRALGNHAFAANAFQRYLDEGGAHAPEAAKVRPLLAELDAKVGTITLSVSPPNAAVTIDGQPAHGRVVRVRPGEHEVAASAPGMQDTRVSVALRAGEKTAVALRPEPIPNAASPTREDVTPGRSSSTPAADCGEPPTRFNSTFFIATGVATTGLVMFGVGGLLAASEQRAYEGAASDDEADRHRTRGKNLALIADIGLGVALVGTVVAVIVAMRPMEAAPPPTPGGGRCRLTPKIGPERAVLDLAVSF